MFWVLLKHSYKQFDQIKFGHFLDIMNIILNAQN